METKDIGFQSRRSTVAGLARRCTISVLRGKLSSLIAAMQMGRGQALVQFWILGSDVTPRRPKSIVWREFFGHLGVPVTGQHFRGETRTKPSPGPIAFVPGLA